MRKIAKFIDAFFVLLMVFLLVNSFALVNTVWCVEITTAFLLLIVIPLVALVGIALNILYVLKHKNPLFQVLRYLNFGFIVVVMSYYWGVYNICTIT
jgi:hypothetical protein